MLNDLCKLKLEENYSNYFAHKDTDTH